MTSLRCVYDLRHAPVTFDFAVYLALADCARQLLKRDSIDLTIRTGEYRDFTPRDKETAAAEKDWRVQSILVDACALLPTISTLTVTNEDRGPFEFPLTADARFPYHAADVRRLWQKGADPKVLRAPEYAKQIVAKLLPRPYVTLTLRTSHHSPERNPNLAQWHQFHDWLTERGHQVIVIPDHEDVTGAREFLKYGWALHIGAAYDQRLRLALYEGAVMNVGSSNGPVATAFFSTAPMLQFDQLRASRFNRLKWRAMLGFSAGEQYPWSAPNQRMTWEDSDANTLRSHFESIMQQASAAA